MRKMIFWNNSQTLLQALDPALKAARDDKLVSSRAAFSAELSALENTPLPSIGFNLSKFSLERLHPQGEGGRQAGWGDQNNILNHSFLAFFYPPIRPVGHLPPAGEGVTKQSFLNTRDNALNRMITFFLTLFISYLPTAMAVTIQDPTRPALFKEHTIDSGQLTLTAILISSDRKIAMINGKLLKIGDEVGGYKVNAIDSNTVQLEGISGTITLYLVNSIKH